MTKKALVKNLVLAMMMLRLSTCWAEKTACNKYCNYYIEPFGDSPEQGIKNFLCNMALVVRNAVSLDSMIVLTGFTPLYLGARYIDEDVHRSFYDFEHHRNLDYPCKHLEFVVHGSMTYPVIILSGLMLFSSDENVRLTGGVAMSGIVVTQLTNQLIKHLYQMGPIRAGCRPRNQNFNPHKRVYNGFPSGHALACAYISVLVGLRLGPKWAIPIGGLCALIAGLTIQCNRHYTSQVVAGAAIGTLFAVATNKVIASKLSHSSCTYELGISVDKNSNPCLEAAINF